MHHVSPASSSAPLAAIPIESQVFAEGHWSSSHTAKWDFTQIQLGKKLNAQHSSSTGNACTENTWAQCAPLQTYLSSMHWIANTFELDALYWKHTWAQYTALKTHRSSMHLITNTSELNALHWIHTWAQCTPLQTYLSLMHYTENTPELNTLQCKHI